MNILVILLLSCLVYLPRCLSFHISSGIPIKIVKSFPLTRKLSSTTHCFAKPSSSNIDTKTTVPDEIVPSKQAYLTLATLVAIFAANQWCRQAIYYLCDFSQYDDAFKHINQDLHFTQDQYATLASLGFTLVFTFFSLFAGKVSDDFNRRNIAVYACLLWSLITGLQYFATSYQDLLPLRAMVGASQAFFNPAAYTLIADLFPPQLVGTMNGIFSGGIYLGGALASLSILIDDQIGWRNTMAIIGGVGVLLAGLGRLLIVEPRIATNSIKTSSQPLSIQNASVSFDKVVQETIVAVKDVFSSTEAKLLYLASSLRFSAGFTIVIWKAPFIFAKFPESEALFAGGNAFIVAVGGFLSSLLGGYLSDYLARTGKNKSNSDSSSSNDDKSTSNIFGRPLARAWVPAVGSLLAAPCWAGFINAETPNLAFAYLLAEYLTAECWFGPTLANLFQVVPKTRRGTAQGIFSLLIAAGNLGPILVSNLIRDNNNGLDVALVGAVGIPYVISGLIFTYIAIQEDKRSKSQSITTQV